MKRRDVIKSLMGSVILMVLFTAPVYASQLESSKLVTGTKSLITDATTVLTGLVALITAGIAIKNAIAWNAASDEKKPKAKERFITDIAIGVIGTVVGGLITVILSYYA